jgi:hypothetical protein
MKKASKIAITATPVQQVAAQAAVKKAAPVPAPRLASNHNETLLTH